MPACLLSLTLQVALAWCAQLPLPGPRIKGTPEGGPQRDGEREHRILSAKARDSSYQRGKRRLVLDGDRVKCGWVEEVVVELSAGFGDKSEDISFGLC